jgi:hypothetical protein
MTWLGGEQTVDFAGGPVDVYTCGAGGAGKFYQNSRMNASLNSRPQALDRSWRKSRIAARIWLRHENGGLTKRDYRLAPLLAKDPGVSERLIDQAVAYFTASKNIRRVPARSH